MAFASLVIGIIALVGVGVGLFPCLGWLNWSNIPLGVLGLILGALALATGKGTDADRGQAIGGIVLNAVVVIVGFMRLVLGGGVF